MNPLLALTRDVTLTLPNDQSANTSVSRDMESTSMIISTSASSSSSSADGSVDIDDVVDDIYNGSMVEILERLNHERAMYMIPAMIWVGMLMVLGVVGNSLVVYVYRRRFKKTSSNYFILTMAIFDLIACVIGMPTELYDLNNPYTFYSPIGCKIFRGCETFTIYGSAMVLVEIAFDRYFKICRPLMVVSLFKIKMLIALAVFLTVFLTICPLILYGTTRIETSVPGVYGYDCSIAEEYKNSTFQTVFYSSLATLFVLILIILTVLYTRIWLEIRLRRRMVIGDQLTKTKTTEVDNSDRDRNRMRIKYLPSVSEDDSCNNSVCLKSASMTELHALSATSPVGGTKSKTPELRRAKFSTFTPSKFKVTRTTVVLFAVTVAFVISYMPAIAIMLARSISKDFDRNQTNGSRVIAKIFSNFMFINNAVNPIIYSFLNLNFRKQVKITVRKLLCCIRRKRKSPINLTSDRSIRREFIIRD